MVWNESFDANHAHRLLRRDARRRLVLRMAPRPMLNGQPRQPIGTVREGGRAAPTRRKARKQEGEQKPADGKPAEGKAVEDKATDGKATDGKAAEPKAETKADVGAGAAAEKKPSPTK